MELMQYYGEEMNSRLYQELTDGEELETIIQHIYKLMYMTQKEKKVQTTQDLLDDFRKKMKFASIPQRSQRIFVQNSLDMELPSQSHSTMINPPQQRVSQANWNFRMAQA